MSKKNKKRAVQGTNRNRRNRRPRRRQSSFANDPLVWVGAAAGIIVVLLALGVWQSGVLAEPPAPSRDENTANLLPLSTAGPSLWGGHDMALIPQQTPAPRPVPPDATAPQLNMPSVSHDFGRVYEQWDVTHIFAVQNTGDADLVIGNLVTSCDCTTAELSSSVIPPGQRADLTVTFDANYHETIGEVSRLVWFASNDPTQPWVEMRVIADVR